MEEIEMTWSKAIKKARRDAKKEVFDDLEKHEIQQGHVIKFFQLKKKHLG